MAWWNTVDWRVQGQEQTSASPSLCGQFWRGRGGEQTKDFQSQNRKIWKYWLFNRLLYGNYYEIVFCFPFYYPPIIFITCIYKQNLFIHFINLIESLYSHSSPLSDLPTSSSLLVQSMPNPLLSSPPPQMCTSRTSTWSGLCSCIGRQRTWYQTFRNHSTSQLSNDLQKWHDNETLCRLSKRGKLGSSNFCPPPHISMFRKLWGIQIPLFLISLSTSSLSLEPFPHQTGSMMLSHW